MKSLGAANTEAARMGKRFITRMIVELFSGGGWVGFSCRVGPWQVESGGLLYPLAWLVRN